MRDNREGEREEGDTEEREGDNVRGGRESRSVKIIKAVVLRGCWPPTLKN